MKQIYEDPKQPHNIDEKTALAEQLSESLREAQEANAKIAEQSSFMSYFFEQYQSAYYLNLETGEATIYKHSREIKNDNDFIEDFIWVMLEETEVAAAPEERAELREIFSIAFIRNCMKDNPVFTHKFRDIYFGTDTYILLEIVRGADESHVAVGFKDITEEHRLELEKQKQLDQYNKILNALSEDFTCVDYVELEKDKRKDKTVECRISDRLLRLIPEWESEVFYTKRLDLILKHLVYEPDKQRFYDETRREEIIRHLEKFDSYFINVRFLLNNEVIYHQLKFSATRTDGKLIGFVVGLHSVHEQMKKEKEQQEQIENALTESMLANQRNETLHDIIKSGSWSFIVEPDNKTVSVHFSDELKRLVHFDLPADPYSWTELVHPEDRDRAGRLFWDALFDPTCKTQYDDVYRMRGEDYVYRWFHSSGRKMRLPNGKSEIFGMFMDVTDRMNQEREQQRQLKEAFESAQSANHAKTTFLNNMSHDIRTPMNAIMGYTSMTQKYIDNPERAKDYLGKISSAGSNLLKLINQVLDMSRIESGKIVLTEEPADVVDKAYELSEIMRHSADVKNIQLTTDFNNVTDRKVFADSGRVNQLLFNLLGNAVKYTPEGGHISYTVKQTDSEKPGYGTYIFIIEDDGIGMSKKYLTKIFEPFSRENTSTVSKIQGTGLGMSIVRRLVDLMGGNINVESEQGRGTTITLMLSFRLDEQSAGSQQSAVSVGRDTAILKGRHVLLVEDNEMNSEIAKFILEEHGMTVETADDGDVAVARIRQLADTGNLHHFDFILMDIQMPRMNGYEATRQIRDLERSAAAHVENERIHNSQCIMHNDVMSPTANQESVDRRQLTVDVGKHIPIIALSANAFSEDRRRSLEAGLDGHISKPIDVPELLHTLIQLLR